MPSQIRRLHQPKDAVHAKRQASDLDVMLARTGDGAFVIDGAGRIVSWNPEAERILGYAAHEVIGRACCDVLDGLDHSGNRMCRNLCNPRMMLEADEVVRPYDMRTRSKAGAPIWINVSVLSLPPITVHLFRDVTVQRRLLELLHERNRDGGPPDTAAPPLSAREIEVLKLVAAGTSTADIAGRLFVSATTIRNHVQAILRKLGVHSRLEAITLATRRGWV